MTMMKPQLETILSVNSFSLDAQHRSDNFDYPYHFHPEYELIIILSSSGKRYVANHIEDFEPLDFILLAPNLPHCWKNADLNIPGHSIVIKWSDSMLGNGWLEKKEFEPIKHLLRLSEKGIHFSRAIALACKDKMQEMLQSEPLEKVLQLVRLLHFLSQTEDYRIICNNTFLPVCVNSQNETMEKVKEYVMKNYREKITLASAAEFVNMSGQSFCRFFAKKFKKSFFSYVHEYRIGLACKLLVESDIQISAVPLKVGYDSYSFFFKQFKKYKNCSPVQFRAHCFKD